MTTIIERETIIEHDDYNLFDPDNAQNTITRMARALWVHNGKPFCDPNRICYDENCRDYYMSAARCAWEASRSSRLEDVEDDVLDIIALAILNNPNIKLNFNLLVCDKPDAIRMLREFAVKPILDRLTEAGYAIGSFE